MSGPTQGHEFMLAFGFPRGTTNCGIFKAGLCSLSTTPTGLMVGVGRLG